MHPTRTYYNQNQSERSDGYGYSKGGGNNKLIKIESTHVGRIIGPAGSTIKGLQSQHNVRINISKSQNSDGTKDVEITGNDDDIQEVISFTFLYINRLIKKVFEKKN
jgi:hypothetical protein